MNYHTESSGFPILSTSVAIVGKFWIDAGNIVMDSIVIGVKLHRNLNHKNYGRYYYVIEINWTCVLAGAELRQHRSGLAVKPDLLRYHRREITVKSIAIFGEQYWWCSLQELYSYIVIVINLTCAFASHIDITSDQR